MSIEDRVEPKERKRIVRRDNSVNRILEVYDSRRYTVVAFENGRRVSTYSNLSLITMSQEVLLRTSRGQKFMVFEAGKEPISMRPSLVEYDQKVWEAAIQY